MKWGEKASEVPKELEDLGMTPAQIREAVLANKDLTKQVADSKTELSTVKTTLASMESSFTENKRKLDELEASSRRPARQDNNEERVYTSFVDDENRAFSERLADGLKPVAEVALIAAANSAKISAKLSLQGQFVQTPGGKISLSRLWDKWSAEIDKAASEVALAVKANQQTWINLFDYIKGKHFNELMAEPMTFVETVSSNKDTFNQGEHHEPEKLNDEESSIIKKMSRYGKGVNAETYQKMKTTIKTVSV